MVCVFGAGTCKEQADVVFVVDNSATISEPKYLQLRNFLVNVVAQLHIDSGKIRVAVITFSDTAIIRFPLSAYSTRSDVVNEVRALPYVGYETDTAAALRLLRNDLFIKYVTIAINSFCLRRPTKFYVSTYPRAYWKGGMS